jgi:hypothetical protein
MRWLRWTAMDRNELQAYLNAQVQEIQKYKWIESERLNHDIGFDRAALEWINLYSDSFRSHWFMDGRRAKRQDELLLTH